MSFLKLYEDFLQKKEGEQRFQSAGGEASQIFDDQVKSIADPIEAAAIAVVNSGQKVKKMEHSYMRDDAKIAANNAQNSTGLSAARTILVRRAPQCPSCHTHPLEEEDLDDDNKVPIPTYNELLSKEAMNECSRIAKYVKNLNSDDEDWEIKIIQFSWTDEQKELFAKVADVLNKDHLGRLAIVGTMNEVMQRRILVDTSAARLRKILAGVFWDVRLTQWLHGILMDNLPSDYMGSYLDILQTLKSKVSTLLDKMLFGRPLTFSQELLAPVLKQRWEPLFTPKPRKPFPNTVFLVIPSHFGLAKSSRRQQRWLTQLRSVGNVEIISLPTASGKIFRQPIGQIAEQIVSLARVKIQELRNDDNIRHIILLGFNAGSAMALQVAMSANVTSVICIGFAYNTLTGVRGAPDDRLLDIKVPILFVIGQNAARTSQEEMEALRERMQSETSLVVVGCADDVLRVPRSKRRIENVTQLTVDYMVMDELYEYVKRILANPPGPRAPVQITGVYSRVGKNSIYQNAVNDGSMIANMDGKSNTPQRKRKLQEINTNQNESTPKKYVAAIGRPRVKPLVTNMANTPMAQNSKKIINLQKPTILSNEDLSDAMHTILADDSNEAHNMLTTNTLESSPSGKPMQSFELIATPSKTSPHKTTTISPAPIGSKIKLIPSNQFVQLKPGTISNMQTSAKIYKIESPPAVLNNSHTGIGSIVSTAGNLQQSKIIQIKTPMLSNQQKFTIVKSPNGTTRLKLNNPSPSSTASTVSNDVDISNIINMPIVFADQQGNITGGDTVTQPQTSNMGKYIISQKIIKPMTSQAMSVDNRPTAVNISGKTYILNKNTNTTTNAQKLVFVNRNANNLTSPMAGNISEPFKNVRMVMSNTKPAIGRPQIVPITGAAAVSSTIKQLNLQSSKIQILKNSSPGIVLKPGQFKTTNIKPQILNGLPGVRKFVNFIPMSKSATLATSSSTNATVTGTPIQTAPKIIRLDPIAVMPKDDKISVKDAQSDIMDTFN